MEHATTHAEAGMGKPTRPKATMGRPSKPPEERMGAVAIRFPPDLLAEIDTLRAERLDAPDRSAMIRELVAEAIIARRKGRKS